MKILTILKQIAKESNVDVIEKRPGHFQIRGKFLINYWPDSKKRTAYVAGTSISERNVTPEMAVKMANDFKGYDIKVPRKSRNRLKKRMRLAVKQKAICSICLKPINNITIARTDHIIPLSKGGLDNNNNKQLVHNYCDIKKGNKV